MKPSSQANLDPSNYPEELKCSSDFVANMLATLDISKSSGPDSISSRMLKSTVYSIAPSFNLITLSLKVNFLQSGKLLE